MLLNFYSPTVKYKEKNFLKGVPSKKQNKNKKEQILPLGRGAGLLLFLGTLTAIFSFPNLPRVLCFLPLL